MRICTYMLLQKNPKRKGKLCSCPIALYQEEFGERQDIWVIFSGVNQSMPVLPRAQCVQSSPPSFYSHSNHLRKVVQENECVKFRRFLPQLTPNCHPLWNTGSYQALVIVPIFPFSDLVYWLFTEFYLSWNLKADRSYLRISWRF